MSVQALLVTFKYFFVCKRHPFKDKFVFVRSTWIVCLEASYARPTTRLEKLYRSHTALVESQAMLETAMMSIRSWPRSQVSGLLWGDGQS